MHSFDLSTTVSNVVDAPEFGDWDVGDRGVARCGERWFELETTCRRRQLDRETARQLEEL